MLQDRWWRHLHDANRSSLTGRRAAAAVLLLWFAVLLAGVRIAVAVSLGRDPLLRWLAGEPA